MRTVLPLIIMIWLVPDLFGQVQYSYDNAGNRISKVIFLNSSRGMQDDASDDNAPRTRAEVSENDVFPRYEDRLGERNVVIYPNPTRGMLQIEFQGYGEMQDARLLLYNMQGSLLRQVNNVESSVTLDLSPYPAGMYILILMEGFERSEWRIIKQ